MFKEVIMSHQANICIVIAILFCGECVKSKNILQSGYQQFDDNYYKSKDVLKAKDVLAIVILTRENTDYFQLKTKSFSDNNSDESDSDVDNKTELDNVESSEESDGVEDWNQEEYLQGLRNTDRGILRNVWKGCSKKAAKACKKACYSAYKNVCAEYSCRSRLKKAFKRECKSSCKSKFGASYISD